MTPDALRDLTSRIIRGYRRAWDDAYHRVSPINYDADKVTGTVDPRIPEPHHGITSRLLDAQRAIVNAHAVAATEGLADHWAGPAVPDRVTTPAVIVTHTTALVVHYRHKDHVNPAVVEQLEAVARKLAPWIREPFEPAPEQRDCLHCVTYDRKPQVNKRRPGGKWCDACTSAHRPERRGPDGKCGLCRDAEPQAIAS